jgi:hypothetical protein
MSDRLYDIVTFILGLAFGLSFVLVIFHLQMFNSYGVMGLYKWDEGLVCYSPISVVDMKGTIYHEECHHLVVNDFAHFCEGEGSIHIYN